MSKLTELASKSLGSENSYAVWTKKFDPSLLNPIPRELAREELNIQTDIWSFGYDVWNCHEATFLTDNGVPFAGTLKFSYPSTSEYMIESKSMKLYLNSFDMCKMGATFKSASENYVRQIESDLRNALGIDDFHCHFFSENEYNEANRADPLAGSTNLLLSIDDIDKIEIDDYHGKKNHLEIEKSCEIPHEFTFHTNILRSRCRHTKQKDTGTALIKYTSKAVISPESILREIVSMREMNKFHEETAEKAYNDFYSVLEPYGDFKLSVVFLYSRRGSLDITPIRSNDNCFSEYVKPYIVSVKSQGQ